MGNGQVKTRERRDPRQARIERVGVDVQRLGGRLASQPAVDERAQRADPLAAVRRVVLGKRLDDESLERVVEDGRVEQAALEQELALPDATPQSEPGSDVDELPQRVEGVAEPFARRAGRERERRLGPRERALVAIGLDEPDDAARLLDDEDARRPQRAHQLEVGVVAAARDERRVGAADDEAGCSRTARQLVRRGEVEQGGQRRARQAVVSGIAPLELGRVHLADRRRNRSEKLTYRCVAASRPRACSRCSAASAIVRQARAPPIW